MMVEHEAAQLFGLAGTFPRPGWVVLDAAREHRFTGELQFDTDPTVRVYFDRGRIYLAERVGDPSLGSRLVDAGALTAAQLEHGSVRLGDVEHLGRLFERVPALDRHAVLVTKELLSDECISWLASQQVPAVDLTPYRHHPSGLHHWDRPDDAIDLAPGDPLPAPPPTAAPVGVTPPEPLFAPPETFDDEVIQWDEPSWLDAPRNGRHARATDGVPAPPNSQPFAPRAAPPQPAAPADRPPPAPMATAPDDLSSLSISGDWIDRLERDGLPSMGSDPLARPKQLPPLPVEPHDRFEVIWPSGEVDEQFGASEVATIDDHHPDLDRPGPTAKVATPTRERPMPQPAPLDVRRAPTPEPIATTADATVEAPEAAPDEAGDEAGDEVVLAVRRAVASIETGALAARRRLTEPGLGDPSRGREPTPPGRVAVRDEQLDWSGGAMRSPARSVFDEPAVSSVPVEPTVASPAAGAVAEPEDRRGALRRLIGSLRRR